MKNLLLIAFSCQPGKGSEPGVGWNWAIQAAKTQNVYVLTRSKMKPYIETQIPDELKNTLHFIYTPSSAKLRSITIYLEYLHWQRQAYKKAKEFLKTTEIDYIWHLTWGNMFLPTYMYKLDKPFIWGPIGGDGAPKQFFKLFSKKKQVIHNIKYFMGKNTWLFPWVRKAANGASIIIARTEETKLMFSKRNQKKTIVRLEACIDVDSSFSYPKNEREILKLGKGKNLIYTGRLIDFKNIPMLLEIMNDVRKQYPDIKLHIIGEGEDLGKCKQFVVNHGMEANIEFYGFVDRTVMLKALKSCDLFVFPSLREGASWSLLEAMAYEIPIIAFDVNGIHDTLKDSEAVLVNIDQKSPQEAKQLFMNALDSCLKMDDNHLKRIGESERTALIHNFSCEGVSAFIDALVSVERRKPE